MDLAKALEQQGVSQRELGRRLDYDSNGVISGVLKKRIGVPSNDIPKWADALGLIGDDRQAFIDYYAEISIPSWYRQRLERAESEIVELRAEAAKLRAKIDKIVVKRHKPSAE
jgi:transcriptional regulator with XRE-family HTH domain